MTPQLHIQGTAPETLVMLHGWPDTHRVWDKQAAFFSAHYRTVRFTLPGFGAQANSQRGFGLDDVIEGIRAAIDEASPDQPVVLMIHDWGCVFGYEFAARYPEKVRKIVAIDIGDANSSVYRKALPASAKAMLLTYQLVLASAWKAPARIGDAITRNLAKALKAKALPEHIFAHMNFPYAMRWLGAFGGLKALKPVQPRHPIFYAYGLKKPFMFQSESWLQGLSAQPQNRVQAFKSGHWVMLDRAEEFNTQVLAWLQG
jgi:pimeloyl-ACP methyl ester carboxylesterase